MNTFVLFLGPIEKIAPNKSQQDFLCVSRTCSTFTGALSRAPQRRGSPRDRRELERTSLLADQRHFSTFKCSRVYPPQLARLLRHQRPVGGHQRRWGCCAASWRGQGRTKKCRDSRIYEVADGQLRTLVRQLQVNGVYEVLQKVERHVPRAVAYDADVSGRFDACALATSSRVNRQPTFARVTVTEKRTVVFSSGGAGDLIYL